MTTPETATATRVDGLLIDEETGEILEGDGIATEQLQLNHIAAGDQEKDWKATKQAYGRALQRRLDEAGTRALNTDSGRTWEVAGSVTLKARASAVLEAKSLELMNDAQAERLLLAAAKELDPEIVQAHIADIAGENEGLRRQLRRQLIDEQPRSGYVQSKAPKRDAPKVERVEVPA